MLKYIIKRFGIAIPQLIGITFITFALIGGTPGSYLDSLKMDPTFSEDTIEHYQKLYGLDKSWVHQYFLWVKNVCKFEFGYSFHYNVPVSKIIFSRLFNTFLLAFTSFFITWCVALPLGMWAAVNRNRFIDKTIQFSSYICMSFPSFFLAMIFLYWASQTNLLPLGGLHSPNYDDFSFFGKIFDVLKHLAIPTIVLSIGSIAALQRIMRGNMLEVLGQNYILAARAKGLPEHRVIYSHALRNAINPLITLLGFEFSSLLSGAGIIEIICSWPGLGTLMLTAVFSKDIYLVMAGVLMGSCLLIVGNLIADIALAKIDPRIRID